MKHAAWIPELEALADAPAAAPQWHKAAAARVRTRVTFVGGAAPPAPAGRGGLGSTSAGAGARGPVRARKGLLKSTGEAARPAAEAILGPLQRVERREQPPRGLQSCPLFTRLGAEAQARLLASGKNREFAPGGLLVRQGDVAGSMFFIDHGQCSAVRDGRAVERLSTGDCFGCMAIIQTEMVTQAAGVTSPRLLGTHGAPRRCSSILADTHCRAVELDADTALDIFTSDASLWAYFYEVAASNDRHTLIPLRPHSSHDDEEALLER